MEDRCEIFLDFLALVGLAQQVKRFIEAHCCRLKTLLSLFIFISKLSLSIFTFVSNFHFQYLLLSASHLILLQLHMAGSDLVVDAKDLL